MTRHVLVCLCLMGLVSTTRAGAQEPAFSGFYAIASNVTWAGNHVVIDLTIALTNEGSRPALNAQVSVAPPHTPLSAPDGTDMFARLNAVDIQPGERARLTSRITLPADEWIRWQQPSETPHFRVGYHDDVDGTVVGPLRLSRVGDIPD